MVDLVEVAGARGAELDLLAVAPAVQRLAVRGRPAVVVLDRRVREAHDVELGRRRVDVVHDHEGHVGAPDRGLALDGEVRHVEGLGGVDRRRAEAERDDDVAPVLEVLAVPGVV